MPSQKIMPRNKANQLKSRPIVENNITITHKDVARDWDYEKNYPLIPEQFVKGSGKKVWWICDKGHRQTSSNLHTNVCRSY